IVLRVEEADAEFAIRAGAGRDAVRGGCACGDQVHRGVCFGFGTGFAARRRDRQRFCGRARGSRVSLGSRHVRTGAEGTRTQCRCTVRIVEQVLELAHAAFPYVDRAAGDSALTCGASRQRSRLVIALSIVAAAGAPKSMSVESFSPAEGIMAVV